MGHTANHTANLTAQHTLTCDFGAGAEVAAAVHLVLELGVFGVFQLRAEREPVDDGLDLLGDFDAGNLAVRPARQALKTIGSCRR